MKFTVNGYEWKIAYENSDSIYMNQDGKLLFGITEFVTQEIFIRKDLSKRATEATIIHELGHCFLFSYGIDHGIYDEEAMCNFLGCYADSIIELKNKFLKERG